MNLHKYKRSLSKACLIATAILLTGCSGEKSANQYNKEGLEFFKEGKYEEAKESLNEAVKSNPDKAEYYIDYGMSLIKTGEYEEALIQFDRAILKNDNKIVRENNKRAYRGRGITFFEQAEYENAMKEFEIALNISELDDLDLDILYYKGEAEEKSGLYKEAQATYETILSKKKSDASIYGKLGQVLEKNGNFEEAVKNYDKAISLDDRNYNLLFGKYFLYLNNGDTEKANAVLTEALAIQAKTDEDYYNLARLHYYKGDYVSAESELKDSASKGFTTAYYYLGRIYQSDKDYDQAISMFEQYLADENNSKSATAYNQLGVCYMEKENFEKALEAIETGIALNDESVKYNLLTNQVTLLEHLVDYDSAFEKANEFLKLYPEDKAMKNELEFIKTRIDYKEAEETKKDKNDKSEADADSDTKEDKKEDKKEE